MDTSGFSKLPTEIKQLTIPFSRIRDLASFRLLFHDAFEAVEKQSYELIKQYFPYLSAQKNYFELLISQLKKVYSISGYHYTLENQEANILTYHLAALIGDSEAIITAPISWKFKRSLHAILIASGHSPLKLSTQESKKESKVLFEAEGEYADFCSIICKALLTAATLGNLSSLSTILKNSSIIQEAKGYALLEAVKNNHLSIVAELLENNVFPMDVQINYKEDAFYDEYDARQLSIGIAIENKNYLILKTLLDNQPKEDYLDECSNIDFDGKHYITKAIASGDISIVKLILPLNGPDILLDAEIKNAEEKGFVEIVELLKAYGAMQLAWVDAVCNNDIVGMRALAQKGINIMTSIKVDEEYYSPLKIVSQRGYSSALQELLALEYKISTRQGYKALCEAGKLGHTEIMRILVKQLGINPNQEGKNGIPLIYFVEQGCVDAAREMVSLDANPLVTKKNRTLLMIAAANNQIEMAKFLVLELNFKINEPDIFSWTPLMAATIEGHIKTVKFLVNELGANLHLTTNKGSTALMLAAFYGHPELICFFKSLGSSINEINHAGWTPLMMAVENGHLKVVEILLKLNASLSAMNKKGDCVLMIAAEKGDITILEKLLDAGAYQQENNRYELLSEKASALLKNTILKQIEKKTDILITKIDGEVVNAREEQEPICSSICGGLHFLWSCLSTSKALDNKDEIAVNKPHDYTSAKKNK